MTTPAELLTLRKQKAITNFQAIPGFKGELYEFQKVGVAYALAAGKSLNADVTGVGKTVQALALMQILHNQSQLYPFLIMVPASLLYQWQREMHRFTGLRAILLRGSKYERLMKLSRFPQAIIMNYELFVRYPDMFKEYPFFKFIAFDEATAFKNPLAKTTAAVHALAKRADRLLTLSATPVQTTLTDMWSIMHPCNIPDYPTLDEFETEHIKFRMIDTRWRGRRVKFKKLLGYNDLPGAKRLFEPYFIRRKLDEIDAELPELVWRGETLELIPAQMEVYRRALNSESFNIIQLQQLVSMAQVDGRWVSTKLDRVIELLTGELARQKVLVFSYFKAPIAELSRRLKTARIGNPEPGIDHVIITGDVVGQRREEAKTRFMEKRTCYVLIGDGAMEKGLNLQVASYMILLDQYSNPARTEQLVGRFRRIDSVHRTIIAIPLVAANTHEEAIHTLIRERAALAGYMMSEGSELYPDLGPVEIRKLLKMAMEHGVG